MKRFFTYLILSLFPLLLKAGTPNQQQGAVIVFKETEFDFGDVAEEGGYISHNFEFENTGTEDLIIYNVRSTGGGQVADWSKQPVSPKEKGVIKIIYTPKGKYGFFNKICVVSSNDTTNNVILRIKGEIKNIISFPEKEYNFGQVIENTEVSHTFEFYNNYHKPILIEKAEVDNRFNPETRAYVSDYSKTIEPQEKGFVTVVVKPYTWHSTRAVNLLFNYGNEGSHSLFIEWEGVQKGTKE